MTGPRFYVQIDKGIMMPPIHRGSTIELKVYWPFAQMEVGDSFMVPEGTSSERAWSTLSKMRKELLIPRKREFVARNGPNNEQRVWRTK